MHRLISPVRVADVTQPVHIELPGIVHRVRGRSPAPLVVLASTDAAYKNAYAVQPVTRPRPGTDRAGALSCPVAC